jgi:hypothetical protein
MYGSVMKYNPADYTSSRAICSSTSATQQPFASFPPVAFSPTPPADPLADIATELGDLSEISEVSQFLAKILKLACQNRISISRATALTFIANSLLNSLRLLNAEDRIAAKEPTELRIDWTGVPRPDRERQNPPPSHPLPVRNAVPSPTSA